MEQVLKLCEVVNRCLSPKLAQDFNEAKNHPEFYIRERYLKDNFHYIIKIVSDVNLKTLPHASILLSEFVILYEELKSEGPWSSVMCKEHVQKMNCCFDAVYSIGVNKILKSTIFNAQEVFDESIKMLHQTVTAGNYRQYPGLVEVYSSLVQNDYKLSINPAAVLPLSLLLIDDYDPAYKTKGLKCCSSVLHKLDHNSFQEGNFYEVVLASLLKAATEKDIEIMSLVLENLIQLLRILPERGKKPAVDKVFVKILDQTMTESNLYIKAACLNFIANLIEMHGIDCIYRKSFKTILRDCFDECTNVAVAEILLPSAIEVLEMWIQRCWCTWHLSFDHKLLSTLLKLLYVSKEESFVTQIQNLIITLIGLCTKMEQTKIIQSLGTTADIKNDQFLKRLQKIKNRLVVSYKFV